MSNKPYKPYILGLDIGTNSIGWAVVDCQVSVEKDKLSPRLSPTGLRAFNSRIFQEMVEAKTKEPKNKQRREARGRRRGLARHKGARLALYKCLIKEKLLPEDIDPESPEETFNSIDRNFAERQTGKPWSSDWNNTEKNLASPFAMRALGLDHPLEHYEFGRVLLQLQQRRGYFSNRGAKYVSLYETLGITEEQEKKEIAADETQQSSDTETKEKDKTEADEKRKVLGGIKKLEREMEKLKCRTIGEFVWKKSKIEKLPAKRITNYYVETKIEKGRKEGETSKDNLYGNRFLYKKEFGLLWQRQEESLRLSKKLKEKVQEVIFYQRPLKIQKNLVGRCSFLIDKPRAAKALLEAQEFRIRTAINNIMTHGYGQYEYKRLTSEKRELLYEALNNPEELNRQGRLSWQKVRKIIGLKPKREFGSEKLNLEAGEGEDASAPNDGSFSKSGIVGNLTHQALLEVIPEQWREFSEEKKRKLVEDLLTVHDKEALFNRLTNKYKPFWTKKDGSPLFTEEQALDLARAELETGYTNHCLKVIKKLLPRLRKGENYHDACMGSDFLKKTNQKKDIEKLESPPVIANPIVQKALHEIRRLVNSVIREYGKPQEVRVELSRDMRASKEQRRKIQKQQKENRKLNEQAEGEIVEHYLSGNRNIELGKTNSGKSYIPREHREKYKLWMELGGTRAKCPYSGEPIASFNRMLDKETEVDHIIPLSLSNDNSYLNKILCLGSENQAKGQKTPWQAWGDNKEKFQEIIGRMQDLIHSCDPQFKKGLRAKLKKIGSKKIPDGFTQAQLKATQYIAVAAKKYLETLSVPVDVTTGRATAELRRLWGLNKLLPEPPEDEDTKRPTTDINGEEVMLYTAEGATKDEAKSRIDHRHHAIDALVVALTDRRVYASLNKRYKHYEKYGKWPDDALALPSLWEEQNVQINREKVKDKIVKMVVSHMTNRKIWGALHEESSYGTSWFYDELELTASPSKKDKKVILGDPNNLKDDCCVWDKNIRKVLQDWLENLPKSKKERTLPEYAGQKLKKATIARRCYVKKIPVKEALKYVAKNEEWKNGTGVWIQNKNTYNVLRDWLRAGNTEKDLADNPPKMKNKNNPDKSNPIESVRTARIFSHASVRGLAEDTKFFQLGSYHHVVIFRCTKEHIEPETGKKWNKGSQRGEFVTMIEAAERASRYRRNWKKGGKIEQVVHRNPEQHNLDTDCWEFVMDLSNNDLVVWEENDIPFEHKELGKPVYRVQKMSGAGDEITFRHHTISTTNNNYGQLRISPSKLRCRKISMDMLGNYKLI